MWDPFREDSKLAKMWVGMKACYKPGKVNLSHIHRILHAKAFENGRNVKDNHSWLLIFKCYFTMSKGPSA